MLGGKLLRLDAAGWVGMISAPRLTATSTDVVKRRMSTTTSTSTSGASARAPARPHSKRAS